MMKNYLCGFCKQGGIALVIALLVILFSSSAIAFPDYSLRMTATLSNETTSGRYVLGFDSAASDDYDGYDGLYLAPQGNTIALSSIANGSVLMSDIRSLVGLFLTETINVTQNMTTNTTGNVSQVLGWSLSLPSNYAVTLYDYGADSSRTTLVTSVDMVAASSYAFTADADNLRYYSIGVIGVCVPDWQCSEYGTCSNDVRTRTCLDMNGCGDDSSKPAETLSCGSSSSGGTSGSRTSGQTISSTARSVCSSDWRCTDWSVCSDNIQTRTCRDNSGCISPTTPKPAETLSCGIVRTSSSVNTVVSDDVVNVVELEAEPQSDLIEVDNSTANVTVEEDEGGLVEFFTPVKGDVNSYIPLSAVILALLLLLFCLLLVALIVKRNQEDDEE